MGEEAKGICVSYTVTNCQAQCQRYRPFVNQREGKKKVLWHQIGLGKGRGIVCGNASKCSYLNKQQENDKVDKEPRLGGNKQNFEIAL